MKKEFFINNRKRFGEKMLDNSIAVFYSNTFIRNTADTFYTFSVDRNFFYLTGIDREDMILIIVKVDNQVREYLYIPPIDISREQWVIPFMREDEAIEKSGISDIIPNDSFKYDFAKKINLLQYIDNIYLFSYITEFDEFDNQYRKLARDIQHNFPTLRILNSYRIMAELRSSKSKEEIEEIKKAIDLTKDALDYAVSKLRPGIFEYEIMANYQYKLALNNAKPRFLTYVASGDNAMILHYDVNRDKVNDKELVLIDAGTYSNWYVSDITRTYPVNGRFTKRQKDIYNIVLEAVDVAIDNMKIGATIKEVNNAVKRYYAKSLKQIGLIRHDEDVQNYYYHGIGHNLGLDQRDLPNKGGALVENAVFTVEPGLYIKEEGIGIRIEDNVLITKDGVVNLSAKIMRTIEDIENYMK